MVFLDTILLFFQPLSYSDGLRTSVTRRKRMQGLPGLALALLSSQITAFMFWPTENMTTLYTIASRPSTDPSNFYVCPICRASTSNCQKESNDLCSICYHPWRSDGSHRVCCLPCGHVYGKSCIENWLETGRPVVVSLSHGELVRYKQCPQCNRQFGKHNIIDLYGIGTSSDQIDRKTLQTITDEPSTDSLNYDVCPYCGVGEDKHTSTCKFDLLLMRVEFLKNEADFIIRESSSLDVDEWYERFKRVPRLSDVALVQNSERPDVVRAQIVRSPSHYTQDNGENDTIIVSVDDDDDENGSDDRNVNGNANNDGAGDSGGNGEEAQ